MSISKGKRFRTYKLLVKSSPEEENIQQGQNQAELWTSEQDVWYKKYTYNINVYVCMHVCVSVCVPGRRAKSTVCGYDSGLSLS